MKIEVKYLKKNTQPGKLLGVVDIALNNSIVIKNIKIIDYNGQKIIAFPGRKVNDQYKDLIHPTTIELRNEISRVIMGAYNDNTYDNGYEDSMYLTDVSVRKIDESNSDLKGIASIVLNNNLCIHSIYIVNKGTDYTLTLPTLIIEGKSFEIIKIINKELEEDIIKKIFEKFKML